MKLNMHIILDELKPFNPKAKLNDSIELHLKHVKIIKEVPRLQSKDYVYVMEAGNLEDETKELPADINIICIGQLTPNGSSSYPVTLSISTLASISRRHSISY